MSNCIKCSRLHVSGWCEILKSGCCNSHPIPPHRVKGLRCGEELDAKTIGGPAWFGYLVLSLLPNNGHGKSHSFVKPDCLPTYIRLSPNPIAASTITKATLPIITWVALLSCDPCDRSFMSVVSPLILHFRLDWRILLLFSLFYLAQ